MKHIWVFCGEQSTFPSGVFSSRDKAEDWISKHGLSGCLTQYPVDEGLYDWAVSQEYFTPKRDDQRTPRFIQRFTCTSTEHFHYENGKEE
jgi:hypothetical protein